MPSWISCPKEPVRKLNLRKNPNEGNGQLVDSCVIFLMFLGCMIHGFLLKFIGLNHAFREINVHVEKIDLIYQCALFSRGVVRHSQINGTQLLHSQNQWSKWICEKLKL